MKKSLLFRFRSLLAVLLCGAMLLLSVGCSSLSDVVAAPSAQDAAPEAASAASQLAPVTDAYANDRTYTAAQYNFETGAVEETESTCTFRIPQITLNTGDTAAINAEIADALHPLIADAVADIEEYGYPELCGEVSYTWSVSEDILSLVIRKSMYPNASGGYEYTVYNLSVSSGTLISDADVIGCAGFSASDYEQRVREVLGSAFWSGWDTSGEYFETETAVEFFNEQLHKTLSPENVDACVPYINEHGQLCIIARLYALAAADYYWHDLNTVDFEYLTYYADDAQLGNGASDMIADVFPEETDSASPAYTVVPLTAEMLSGTWAVDADFTAAYNDMSLNDLYGSSFTGESRMTFAADGSFDYAVAWCFGRGSYTLQDGKLLVTLTEGDPETLAALYAVSDGTVRIAMDQYGDGIPVFWVRK